MKWLFRLELRAWTSNHHAISKNHQTHSSSLGKLNKKLPCLRSYALLGNNWSINITVIWPKYLGSATLCLIRDLWIIRLLQFTFLAYGQLCEFGKKIPGFSERHSLCSSENTFIVPPLLDFWLCKLKGSPHSRMPSHQFRRVVNAMNWYELPNAP